MKFDITLGKSHKSFVLDLPETITCDDVMLMIADKYGDEWYGAAVSCEETKSFYCNAVEHYYTGKLEDGSDDKYYDFPEEYKKRTVYEWALNKYVMHLKLKNNICDKYYDYDGDLCCKAKDIFEEV